MRTVVIQKHQTILDIALQYCGSADALWGIAELNDLSVTATVEPGTIIIVPEIVDQAKEKYLTQGNHKPVTGSLEHVEEAQEGLEYWAIEIDFKIT